ncbi:MmgE/PrpD family protein [Siccirubricoccus phaeus]|uniref:MmgE/PrpD family protein n=1 Tax=Siccirubricoccus phaeus TaxID=2595053 RepID=UPI00165CEA0E|nr:MmgE/PrpD family protein [Siccirubricoccus phaeus]
MTTLDPARTITQSLAAWCAGFAAADLPADLRHATEQRLLNVIGVALAAGARPQGQVAAEAALAMGAPGPCHILGGPDGTLATSAAFANGSMASALAFDDSQTETLIHCTCTTAATALALAEWRGIAGPEVLLAIALGNEAICRIGAVAPGQFHRSGFHPTGIVGAFGAAFVAGRLLGLDAAGLVHAAGIAGTLASGSNECWRDGSWAQIVDPGWASQAGITAAVLAAKGFSGPAAVLEGSFGLFPSHVQDRDYRLDYARATAALGEVWESRNIAIKPYPTGHVSIPFVDCALELHARGARAERIRRVTCHAAQWITPVVCEPAAEKKRPSTDWHCRVSLPFTVAETLFFGRLEASAYSAENRANPALLALAQKVEYVIDPDAPRDERYKGWIEVELDDGTRLESIHFHGRDDHMRDDQLMAKLHSCLRGTPAEGKAEALRSAVTALAQGGEVAAIFTAAAGR